MNPGKVSWTQFITFTLFAPASKSSPLSLIRAGNCWKFVVYKMLRKTKVRYIMEGEKVLCECCNHIGKLECHSPLPSYSQNGKFSSSHMKNIDWQST